MVVPNATLDDQTDGPVLRLSGDFITSNLEAVERQFLDTPAYPSPLQVDISGLARLDTGGAWLIAQLQERLEGDGGALDVVGGSDEHLALIETVREALPEEHVAADRSTGLSDRVEAFGRATVRGGLRFVSLINFVGIILDRLARTLINPRRLRLIALVSHMQNVGLSAVPIVALMGFLIGIVLAFQGAVQLRQFGAEVFVVDLIAVSVLRELGILLTAIIVAGRSGSAFTAAIGSMKVREELDAMRALGLDPIEVLVLPRILALVLMLPILGVIANFCALVGGALMSWVELGISPGMFMTRFSENTDVWHLTVGLIKAPFFAFTIGVVGCWQALQVEGSSESVGERTTASVVQAIFLVIVADAIFSVFFPELGI